MDETIDTSKTYVFTSRISGPNFVLVADENSSNSSSWSVSLANVTDSDPGGQWFLTRVNGNQPGIFYRIHAASLGVAQSVDVVNEGGAVTSTRLKMAPSGDSSGQAWRFNRWSNDEKDGFRLSNKLTGPDMHLDVSLDTLETRLVGGDFAGQHWTMASTQSTSDDESPKLLLTSQIIGISVAAIIALALFTFGLVYWLLKVRRRRRRDSLPTQSPIKGPLRNDSVHSHWSGQYSISHPILRTTETGSPDFHTVSPVSTISSTPVMTIASNAKYLPPAEMLSQPTWVAELPDKKY
jgi:hypothetical protein